MVAVKCSVFRGGILILFFILLINSFKTAFAQKPPLMSNSFKEWDALLDYGISKNGKYFWYTHGSLMQGICINIKGVDTKFEKTGKSPLGSPKFTSDSKYAIYLTSDTLNILNLDVNTHRKIAAVTNFTIPLGKNSRWLSYRSGQETYLLELSSGRIKKYLNIKEAIFNTQGTQMILKGDSSIELVSLPSLELKRIYDRSPVMDIVFDQKGTGFVFCPIIDGAKSLYYFRSGENKVQVLAGKGVGLDSNSKISFRAPEFSRDSKSIFFSLLISKKSSPSPNANYVRPQLALWHYKDAFVQTALSKFKLAKEIECAAVVNIVNKDIILLEKPDSTKISGGSLRGNQFVITNTIGNSGEQTWNEYKEKFYLVSIKDGSATRIFADSEIFSGIPRLSPNETFITWYDYRRQTYRSYEIRTKVIRDLTKNIKVKFSSYSKDRFADAIGGTYGSFWLADNRAFIIYDQYDLWQIDLHGQKKPINITGRIGSINNIKFRLSEDAFKELPYRLGDTILLAAFSEKNKKNGFFKVVLGKENFPDISFMEDKVYYFPYIFANRTPPAPKKSSFGSRYFLQSMSATSAPNIFVTNDFKTYRMLTDVQPQKKYNWMSSELIKWHQADGRELHGILYKPENFDSTKKYPIIFHYYDRSSHTKNLFHIPGLSEGALDIPWYVSNGYLVFVPDIYSPAEHPAKGVVDAVESAVSKLKEFPWVDQARMGLQGHSFGGWETYVLAANTKHFAAAQPSAGPADMILGYSSLGGASSSIYETGQNNIRALPWERPDLYMQSSPFYQVGNVTAPMLIMHNQLDGAVDFSHSLAMYVALRRQKKPVWLLEYNDEGHILSEESNKQDFTIRQQQFFGHYLKGAPMPLWMKEPGNLSLDLDTAKTN